MPETRVKSKYTLSDDWPHNQHRTIWENIAERVIFDVNSASARDVLHYNDIGVIADAIKAEFEARTKIDLGE